MSLEVYHDSNFVTQMTAIISQYLYQGKYSVESLTAFCAMTSDVISSFIPFQKFVQIANSVPHEMKIRMISAADPVFAHLSVSGMSLVLVS